MHTLQFDSLIYHKDRIERPQSWADYWQPQKRYGDKIKGHVINYNPANLLSVYALIHAAELGGGSAQNMEPAWAMLKAQKPNPVAIPGDLKTVSGTQTYKVDGQQDAGGTITVNWTFTRL